MTICSSTSRLATMRLPRQSTSKIATRASCCIVSCSRVDMATRPKRAFAEGYRLRCRNTEGVSMTEGFHYFAHPHRASGYDEQPQPCGICGNVRYGYHGGYYGLNREICFVCEECLLSGRLAEHDLSINIGDIAKLTEQLRRLRPQLDETAILALAQERTAEVEQRTPSPSTWQDFDWPAHCGDYCRFVQEVRLADLTRLAPDGDGRAFFVTHEVGGEEHAEE